MIEQLVKALEGRREGSSWRCQCPVHGGGHLIVSIKEGKPLLHCMQEASQEELMSALRERELWPADGSNPGAMGDLQLVEEYVYRGLDMKPVAIKGRFVDASGRKTFRWRLPHSDRWDGLHGMKEAELPFYGIHNLRGAPAEEPVIIVEGEKAAGACWRRRLLAVCPPGGASAREFDLSDFQGRRVMLWPDNDQPGRALMRRLAQALEGIAESVQIVSPPGLPEHGDAYDYFVAQNRTRQDWEGLLSQLRNEPWVETSSRGFLVSIPQQGGVIRFLLEELDATRSGVLNSEAVIWCEIPGLPRAEFTCRLNLLSMSQRDTLRRQMEDMAPLGKGVWTEVIALACRMAREAFQRQEAGGLLIPSQMAQQEQFVLPPFLPSSGMTILFGPGGSGKTFLALAWAVALETGAHFLDWEPTRRCHVLYLDYEANQQMLEHRLWLLGGAAEARIHYVPGRGIPLVQQVPTLLPLIEREGIDYVIVDSAILAAQGDPEKPEGANSLFSALGRLGKPSLVLSHTTKQGDDRYPYGSIVWHNSARATWALRAERDDEPDCLRLLLLHRKANDDRLYQPVALNARFGERVVFERDDPERFFEEALSLPQRIKRLLIDGPMTTSDLAEALGVSKVTVRVVCGRSKGIHRADTQGREAVWELA